jgi:hypothetical protein
MLVSIPRRGPIYVYIYMYVIRQPISFRIWSRAFRSTDKKSKILETFIRKGMGLPIPYPFPDPPDPKLSSL